MKPMRENNYMTMMDPFQKKYGNILSSALILPALVADVLWVARTLVSLGGSNNPLLYLTLEKKYRAPFVKLHKLHSQKMTNSVSLYLTHHKIKKNWGLFFYVISSPCYGLIDD